MKIEKNYLVQLLIITLLSVLLWGQNMENENMFKTPEEAALKAKDNLVELISKKMLEINATADEIKESKLGSLVKAYQLNFDDILKVDDSGSFDRLKKNEEFTAVPLINQGSVLTAVQLAKRENSWIISGLTLSTIPNELQQISRLINGLDNAKIQILVVPNINAVIYELQKDDSKAYHTNYSDEFDISKEIPPEVLLPYLKKKAMEFNRNYGDELKRTKLVD